jgi:translation initiation factor 1 (eIF-1/SUI1)
VKIKDIAKLFGKKFSSGASVGETAAGAKEVTIQGDVSFDVPPLLVHEYRVDPTTIFYADGNNLTPYA